jgi:anti-sigma regulatory factor (Ser/Thr protein kinase)
MDDMSLLTPVFDPRAKEIHADLVLLSDVRDWAESAARDAGLRNGDCYQVKLAVSEAVANAIQHGSSAPSDLICITAFERAGRLVFEVSDTGEFLLPYEPAGNEDERGRGLQLLALMMDEVQIAAAEGGSVLRFSKRLP